MGDDGWKGARSSCGAGVAEDGPLGGLRGGDGGAAGGPWRHARQKTSWVNTTGAVDVEKVEIGPKVARRRRPHRSTSARDTACDTPTGHG
eukprot:CAMPEP_0119083458 /NCGR_PEP_ID=MMETSP1178-20130426/125617_1 /TAXON_ID=33656 /ORGANISM="unid sp, Strain CCMP2000" /LENGTH=89 /DNA_ID=CAMNT_0007066319 /DNA_START=179 /DNA_END=445 /DNA_ORIENTATION=-